MGSVVKDVANLDVRAGGPTHIGTSSARLVRAMFAALPTAAPEAWASRLDSVMSANWLTIGEGALWPSPRAADTAIPAMAPVTWPSLLVQACRQ